MTANAAEPVLSLPKCLALFATWDVYRPCVRLTPHRNLADITARAIRTGSAGYPIHEIYGVRVCISGNDVAT